MSIPTDVQVNIEDSMSNSGMREVWPTTDAPTSPLWRFAFHEAAAEKFGARWMGAGFVSCGADVAYTVPFDFNSVVERAAVIYTRAVQDPEIIKMFSDEADGKFPFLPDEGRYSIPSS
jgi:hypothetical protein